MRGGCEGTARLFPMLRILPGRGSLCTVEPWAARTARHLQPGPRCCPALLFLLVPPGRAADRCVVLHPQQPRTVRFRIEAGCDASLLTGTLSLKLQLQGAEETVLWTQRGGRGSVWHRGMATIPATGQQRYRVRKGRAVTRGCAGPGLCAGGGTVRAALKLLFVCPSVCPGGSCPSRRCGTASWVTWRWTTWR